MTKNGQICEKSVKMQYIQGKISFSDKTMKKTVLDKRGHRHLNLKREQMIRAMYDSRRLIGRFTQDDSRKNGDDSRK